MSNSMILKWCPVLESAFHFAFETAKIRSKVLQHFLLLLLTRVTGRIGEARTSVERVEQQPWAKKVKTHGHKHRIEYNINKIQEPMVWYMVWYIMMWYDVIQHGMTWYELICYDAMNGKQFDSKHLNHTGSNRLPTSQGTGMSTPTNPSLGRCTCNTVMAPSSCVYRDDDLAWIRIHGSVGQNDWTKGRLDCYNCLVSRGPGGLGNIYIL